HTSYPLSLILVFDLNHVLSLWHRTLHTRITEIFCVYPELSCKFCEPNTHRLPCTSHRELCQQSAPFCDCNDRMHRFIRQGALLFRRSSSMLTVSENACFQSRRVSCISPTSFFFPILS
ncbi:hypothetical protein BKA62DRAFT_719515, partial [Auriculariales sp. MPI-PUGE-AT-0066]